MNKLLRMMNEIENRGLWDLAKSSPAYETANRISLTGKDLGCRFEEMEMYFSEDLKETAKALSKPENWGVTGQEWEKFCKEWNNGN